MLLFIFCKLWQHFSQIHTLWSKGPSLVTAALKPLSQWSILSSYTCQQRGVLLLVLAVGLSSVLEKEGGVFYQTSLYCQEERSLTTRSAAVHWVWAWSWTAGDCQRSVSLQNKRAEDTNLSVWVPEWFGLSGRLLRGEQSNLCCPAVRTCLCAGQTGLSGASHYLESDWVIICMCIKRNTVWKIKGPEFYSEQQNSPDCGPCILPYLAL